MKRKVLSLLLVLSLCLSLFPVTTLAADEKKTIMLGSDTLLENANTAQAATVYLGKDDEDQPAAWRVLGKVRDEGSSLSMDLLAAEAMGVSAFDATGADRTHYEISTLRVAMDNLANKLNDAEKCVLLPKGFWSADDDDVFAGYYSPLLEAEADKVDPSLRKLSSGDFSLPTSEAMWWLRHPNKLPVYEGGSYIPNYYTSIPHVDIEGNIHDSGVSFASPLGVRPTCVLGGPYVLFISSVNGGKAGKVGTMAPISDYSGNEWKITAKNAYRNFKIKHTDVDTANNAVIVNYSGATEGENEYISAILADEQNNPLYYGRASKVESADGQSSVKLPSGLSDGNYTLKVFNECYNGGSDDTNKATDMGSDFQDISITVKGGSVAITDDSTIIIDQALLLGTDLMNKYLNSADAASIYFGKTEQSQPASWRVIGYDGGGTASEAGTATLLAAAQMRNTSFDTSRDANYKGSVLQTAMDDLAASLSDVEKSTISTRTFNDAAGGEQVDNAAFWPLSVEEAEAVNESIRSSYGSSWWLRTRGDGDNDYFAFVNSDGNVNSVGGEIDAKNVLVRPAFHINLDNVLFASAAEINRSGEVGSTLSKISSYDQNTWKLTLYDSSRAGFDVEETYLEAKPGEQVQVTYSGAMNEGKEYISAILADQEGLALYYGHLAANRESGTASIDIPDDLALGSYKLYVFNEECHDQYLVDYSSALEEIDLNVTNMQVETPKPASFTATDDNSGTLANVTTAMQYSVDGGKTWHDVTAETMTITGVSAEKDIQVKLKEEPSASVQTIDVTQAAQPAVSAANCTTADQNDGKITGVDSSMEYKKSDASNWNAIEGTEVTGLTSGEYNVRVKASGTVLASPAATVNIESHTCVGQGDWQSNETQHWKLCSCNAQTDVAEHSWNAEAATEQNDKHCTICGYVAEEKLSHSHSGTLVPGKEATCTEEGVKAYYICDCEKAFEDEACTVEITNLDEWKVIPKLEHSWSTDYLKENADTEKHYHVCTVCGAKDEGEAHSWNAEAATEQNDKHCTICGYVAEAQLTHSHSGTLVPGKEATCTEEGVKAYYICDCEKAFEDEACTVEITNLNEWKVIPKLEHSWSTDYLKENADAEKHYHVCTVCEAKNEGEAHSWNAEAATEQNDKHCTICGYVAEEQLTHSFGSEWMSDADNHWHECACGEKADVAAHEYDNEQDNTCNICGYVRVVSPPHVHSGTLVSGKEATCTEEGVKAYYICDDCEKAFEDAACTVEITNLNEWKVIPKLEHSWSTDYLKENADAEKHYHVCTACGAKNEGEAHSWNAEAATEQNDKHCTICGYVAEEKLTHSHSSTLVSGKEATCTEEGVKAYYICDDCEKAFEDEACTKEITNLDEWKVIPKLEHSWSTDYLKENADAEKHYHVCTVCEAKDEGEAHSYDNDQDKTCNVCGYERQITPSTPSMPSVPSTPSTPVTPEPSEPADSEETVTNADGSTTTTITKEDGSTSTTTVSRNGKVEAEVTLSDEALTQSTESGDTAVALPVPEMTASSDRDIAPTVTVHLPENTTTSKVDIPVENVTAGTVAILVHEDGSEEVLKNTVQTESGISVAVSDGDTLKIVDNSKTFDDVADDHWGAAVIDFVTSRELFAGTAENTFSPDSAMTRAMIWSVLARYEGADTTAAEGSAWYAGTQQWAIDNGISDGTNPNDPMTREQFAAMLYRSAGSPAVSGNVGDFGDTASVSSWASDAMIWVVQNGIIGGYEDSTLRPQNTATRTEVAAMLQRFVILNAQ